jgi:signal transduction histidine kinase
MVLGTLAHELRSPLGVLSNVAMLMESVHPEDEKLAYAKRVLGRQTRYLTTLVDDLLEVSRIRAGKAELHIERVDLSHLLADALEASDAQLRERRQRVELMHPQTPIVLDGDPTRLKQVFVNLISNASRYSEPERQILIRSSTEGDEAVVRVEDQGIGIPPDLLPRIFDLFVQQDPQGQRGSLGLGLSLVKEYVELHGGVVTVRSEGVGHGSEFVVRLPLHRGPAA